MSRTSRKNAAAAAANSTAVAESRPAAVAASPDAVAAVVAAAQASPRVSITFGGKGRPSAAELAAREAAYFRLVELVNASPRPAAPKIPRGVSPRVAAAIRADHAAELAADAMLRTAVVAGRILA